MTDRVFTISCLIGIMTLIGAVTFYHYQQLQAMKSNIESAIVKGIDPVAVKCAYSSSISDSVCAVYAAAATSKK